MEISKLQPGDVLLYRGTGLYGLVIRTKTWHQEGHVEIYMGDGKSIASRNGIGVALYDYRDSDLMEVLRPTVPFQKKACMDWFYHDMNGKPYGWFELLNFVGIPIDTPGIVCSPFVTEALRAGAVPVFPREKSIDIAPFEFRLEGLLQTIYTDEKDYNMWVNLRNWMGKFLVGVAGSIAKHPQVILDAAKAVQSKNPQPLIADVVAIVGDAAKNAQDK